VDHDSVARIRQASFSPALRGYDKHEVDNFLAELADWLETGGEDESRVDVVHNELERIGEQTGAILTAAHEAAEAMRDNADRDARKRLIDANLRVESIQADVDGEMSAAREEVDAYSRKTRADADAHDKATRGAADAYAAKTRVAADAEAKAIVDRANAEAGKIVAAAARKRKDTESVISDLEQRRNTVLSELESLASGITGTATQHRSAPAKATADNGDDDRAEEKPGDDVRGDDDPPEADASRAPTKPIPQRRA
jgi:DivIVA domain-containing protein